MKKTMKAIILALVMFVATTVCLAAEEADFNTADALNKLGLFLGTDNGYELDNGLTRAQGVTLLVRMIGMEEEASNGTYENAFTDVPDWAVGYIGYAYENGITKGTSDTTFSPETDMTDYMFLTLVMRALNYSDMGEKPLFEWNNPYALAYDLGLISKAEPDLEFARADAIRVLWNALDIKLNGTETILADRLVMQNVFTASELAEAKEIQKNGRKENVDMPVNPVFTPETEAPMIVVPEVEISETEVPETKVPDTQIPETEAPETKGPDTQIPETEVEQDPNSRSENETPDW